MGRRITLLQGHPDPGGQRFGHALAQAYAEGAIEAGHELRLIDVAQLDFPWLRTKEDYDAGALPSGLADAQAAIARAEHLAIFFPLWLGTMPALFHAFLEQVLRPGFAFTAGDGKGPPKPALAGRSARLVVTMGMPAAWYRWYFQAHGVRGLERSVLGFCGIRPIARTLIGMVEAGGERRHEHWLAQLRELGRRGT